MTAFACLVALGALALLGLSQAPHYGWWFRRRGDAGTRRIWRRAGLALLAASYAMMISARGGGIGTILWVGALAPIALVLTLMRTYLPRRRATPPHRTHWQSRR